MSSLTGFIYDRVMAQAEVACLRDWRRELLAGLQGSVLEIGAGTGANLAFYPAAVQRIVLCEPDPGMRGALTARAGALQRAVEIRPITAETLDFPDASFDHAVSTLVCCSVGDPARALAQIRRVLKPGGSLVFLEHVAAWDDPGRRRWQDRLNPLWRRLASNCHLNRETEQAIRAAGFAMERIQRESMRKIIPLVRPSIRGVARKPA